MEIKHVEPEESKIWSMELEENNMPDLHAIRESSSEKIHDEDSKDWTKLAFEYLDPTQSKSTPCKILNSKQLFDHLKRKWGKQKKGGIRKDWVEKAKGNRLSKSGLPVVLQKIVEGDSDQAEIEINNYCKLAGVSYILSRKKLEAEAESLKKRCLDIMEHVDFLINSFEQRGESD